jgi:hypothetical protein
LGSFLLVLRKGEEFIDRGLFIQAKGQQRKTRYIFKDICPPLGCDNIDELKYQSPILRVAHFVFFDVKVSSTLTTAVPSTEKTGEKQLGPVNAPAALLYVRSLSAVAGQTNVGRCRGQVSRERVARAFRSACAAAVRSALLARFPKHILFSVWLAIYRDWPGSKWQPATCSCRRAWPLEAAR